MARPPPDCIWRMKNTHTPISSSIGAQEISTFRNGFMLSPTGLASTCTPAFTSLLTSVGSSGVYVSYALPSLVVKATSWPVIVTSCTLPLFTSSRKLEYAIEVSLLWDVEGWKTLNKTTRNSATTTQSAIFRPRLFI